MSIITFVVVVRRTCFRDAAPDLATGLGLMVMSAVYLRGCPTQRNQGTNIPILPSSHQPTINTNVITPHFPPIPSTRFTYGYNINSRTCLSLPSWTPSPCPHDQSLSA